jgi:RNA polymerase sigma factor (sigma-70 family)
VEASALQAPTRLTEISLSAPLLRLRSDDQLVALFRAGSDEAFRAIHDRYRQRLFAYVRQMLAGSRQDAEDALQDVFIRAHGALRATDRPISLRAWLYRVAHNRCIDQLRRPVVVPLEGVELARSDLPDPLAEAERRESLRRLIADVRRLPEQQRSVLLMRELEGSSYADLADAHGVSVAAVKSLLVRARIGLVRAAEARDIACVEIRTDLASAHGRGVRATGRARRHLRDCSSCREYRAALRATDRQLAALTPPSGPLAALAKLLGGAGGGGAAASSSAALSGGAGASGGAVAGGGAAAATVCKVAAVVCSTVVAAGGAVEVSHQIGRGTAGSRDGRTTAVSSAAAASTAGTGAPARAPIRLAAQRAASANQKVVPAARAGADPASGASAKARAPGVAAAPPAKTSVPVTENDFPYGIAERDPRAQGDQSGPATDEGNGTVPLGSDAPAEDPDAPATTTTDPSDPASTGNPAQQQSGFTEVTGPAADTGTPTSGGTAGTSVSGPAGSGGSTSATTGSTPAAAP